MHAPPTDNGPLVLLAELCYLPGLTVFRCISIFQSTAIFVPIAKATESGQSQTLDLPDTVVGRLKIYHKKITGWISHPPGPPPAHSLGQQLSAQSAHGALQAGRQRHSCNRHANHPTGISPEGHAAHFHSLQGCTVTGDPTECKADLALHNLAMSKTHT